MLSKSWKVFRWREEDLRRRIILAPYVFCFWFTCKGLYFSLALGSSLLPTLKRSYCSTRRHFCLVCPPDALKNRHKRHKKIAPRRFVLWLITIVKADNFVWRDHGLIHVIITFFCHPLFLIPSRSFSTWAPHGPKSLHVNPTKGCFAFNDLPPSSVVNSRYINFLCSLCLGQFQLQVLSRCGHSVHEDAPDKVRSSLR